MNLEPIRKIVCAVDFSDITLATLEQSVDLARKYGAHLVIMNVVNERLFEGLERVQGRIGGLEGVADQAIAALEEERAEKLRELLGQVDLAGLPHTARIALGVPWEKILEVAGEEQADLIVLGAKGRSALVRALRFGSSAEKVFRRAACRTLFVR
ncbi:MAG: universal stress protein [Deltaproteobacteria bacterium]|nr:universal stress protein [Deltaproteobacteria bacterium]